MKRSKKIASAAAFASCLFTFAPSCAEECEVKPCTPQCEESPCTPQVEECTPIFYEPCRERSYDFCDDNQCATNCDSCWGKFSVRAEFLYWKPCVDDLDYAAHSDAVIDTNGNSLGTKNGKYKYVNPSWEPGFRLSVAVDELACDWGLIASYARVKSCDYAKTSYNGTYLEATMTHTHDIIGPSVIDTVLFATLDHELTYQDYDILFTSSYCLKPCHTLRPYFGVTGVLFDHHIFSTWQQDGGNNTIHDGTTTWDSCFSSIGFKLGSQYTFALCSGLQFYGAASAAVTVGDNDSVVSFEKIITAQGLEPTVADYSFKDGECIFVPGYQISIGLLYDLCLCGFQLELVAGYEFNQWHNVPNLRRFLSEGPPELACSTSPTVATIGFHGLNLGLGMQF